MNLNLRPKTRISVDRYQMMVAAGVLTKHDRIELIDGEMVDMAPIGRRHLVLTARLNKLLVLAVGDAALVSPGGPVNMGEYSEPEPDLSLLRPRADDYGNKLPEAADVLLLIEVSDSTLAYDQGTKRELYARHGVAEYWIVDVEGERIQIHRGPATGGYAQIVDVATGGTASPLAFPAIQVDVKRLFAA